MDIDALKADIAGKMKEKRLLHVLGCEKEAAKLALFWGADCEKARAAALLHDITKRLGRNEQLKLCEQHSIIMDSVEKTEWKLLHAKTAAAVAKAEYEASDDIVEAIRYHTTGKAAMTLLQKVLYLADCIEETRNYTGVVKLRKLAYRNLDEALLYAFDSAIREVLKRGGVLHPDTVMARNFFVLKEEIIDEAFRGQKEDIL